jgi:hypothetical protein
MILGGSEGTVVPNERPDLGSVKLSYITPWSLLKRRMEEKLMKKIEIAKYRFEKDPVTGEDVLVQ